jgi:pyruvate-formate lyase-activating enzyme
MTKKKRKSVPSAYTIALAKMCGCDKCKYCQAWSEEQTWLGMKRMVDEARQAKEAERNTLTGVNKCGGENK